MALSRFLLLLTTATGISLLFPDAMSAVDDAAGTHPVEAGSPPGSPPGSLSGVLADLSAPDFVKRQQAVVALQRLTADQLAEVGEVIATSGNSDVVRQLIEVVERHYVRRDREQSVVAVASELLESAAESSRWYVAEAARDVLYRHGQRRVSLAMDELVRMNANLDPSSPESFWAAGSDPDRFGFGGRNITRDDILKIIIDRSWPAGPRSRVLLKRLEPLVGSNFLRNRGRLAIILADGHPLTPEEISQLRGVFGDTQIQERGAVSLGVQQDPLMEGEGVHVGYVQKGSSADNAGIQSGDVITMIDGQSLADFDELVAALRKFKPGDKVTLTVLRGAQGFGHGATEEVAVTLQAWGTRADGTADENPDEAEPVEMP